jgi:hypothetical protein
MTSNRGVGTPAATQRSFGEQLVKRHAAGCRSHSRCRARPRRRAPPAPCRLRHRCRAARGRPHPCPRGQRPRDRDWVQFRDRVATAAQRRGDRGARAQRHFALSARAAEHDSDVEKISGLGQCEAERVQKGRKSRRLNVALRFMQVSAGNRLRVPRSSLVASSPMISTSVSSTMPRSARARWRIRAMSASTSAAVASAVVDDENCHAPTKRAPRRRGCP